MSLDAKSPARPVRSDPADSMAMSVLTGVALLCYAANLYLPGAKE